MGNQLAVCLGTSDDLPELEFGREFHYEETGKLFKSTPSGKTRSDEDFLPKNHVWQSVESIDKNTPDNWICRNPALIRLTGKHPLNCEPKLESLYDQGFITPLSIHYVRSHGRVPKLSWNTHRIKVNGLVSHPRSFSMNEIAAMPSVTMPVTLTCAGNRRKEENMIQKTRGFNWGAAATSTSVWTGVKLTHLLAKCGIDLSSALHVRFYASDDEELQPGYFGSSIDIATVMSSLSDTIIAYKQNGEFLQPDHGFPVRVIIPGWVGARMVKWLDTIEVSQETSESHYHYFDNRIFPSFVNEKMAFEEEYWYKDEYVFNEININSVIVHPRDSEVLEAQQGGMYTVSGYAYSGGGRKITRVEISLDGGATWRLTDLRYPEEEMSHAPKYGYYYCWMFWQVEVSTIELISVAGASGELKARAWDSSNNTQPDKIIWNLMGYGNNCQYTVKMSMSKNKENLNSITFSHPTVAGASEKGWMKKTAEAATNKTSNEPKLIATKACETPISLAEVAKHNSKESAWIVVDGKVYDTTKYLYEHPGGAASILIYAGKDATDDFNSIHSNSAKEMLLKYQVGVVEGSDKKSVLALHSGEPKSAVSKELSSALVKNSWTSFELESVKQQSSTLRIMKFKLPLEDQLLGLPVGCHVLASANVDGKHVLRAYTPISASDEPGYFSLGIKVYYPIARFPDGGKMSQHLDRMNVGDTLMFSGPLGMVEYNGNGNFLIDHESRSFKNVALVCGGTGITPAYQVMRAVAKDDSDTTNISLIYGCQNEGEIMLREELDEMSRKRSKNIKVWYTVDKRSQGWQYSVGYVNEKMIRERFPSPGNGTLVLLCGPKPMIQGAVIPLLQRIGHEDKNIVNF